MTNHNKEISQHQEPNLSAKYPQLSKYIELSDIELTVVAGGENSRNICRSSACGSYNNTGTMAPINTPKMP
ncbi:MAG: hypothetical protein KME64_17210 [Scytonematopsis contorta HA4267-MV1]|jgi:hypothetical protein|nr:hypothetical protein [Scytonematopsis contorta HA4267-MV1]